MAHSGVGLGSGAAFTSLQWRRRQLDILKAPLPCLALPQLPSSRSSTRCIFPQRGHVVASSVQEIKLLVKRNMNGRINQTESSARSDEGLQKAWNRATRLLVPILAVAIVGYATPGIHGPAQANAESVSGPESYQELARKMKERRRGSVAPPVTSAKEEAPSPTPGPQNSNVIKEETPLKAEVKKKTHGFMPLFVAQFLLLLAVVGGGYALFAVPESTWEVSQKKFDDIVEKTVPYMDDAFAKAKPVISQAANKTKELGVQAKPYITRAWETSKPLASKAIESTKPLIKNAQDRVADLIEQTKG